MNEFDIMSVKQDFNDIDCCCRNIKVGNQADIGPDERGQGFSSSHTNVNGPQRESKLELFGFDSLVNILGLKR